MSGFEQIHLANRWKLVLKRVSENFGEVEDIKDIIFLIGVQELGQGYRKFNKNEKIDLMHIGVCKLLSHFGYYSFLGRDSDGWPHWKLENEIPELNEEEKDLLFKEAIINYLETE